MGLGRGMVPSIQLPNQPIDAHGAWSGAGERAGPAAGGPRRPQGQQALHNGSVQDVDGWQRLVDEGPQLCNLLDAPATRPSLTAEIAKRSLYLETITERPWDEDVGSLAREPKLTY